MTTSPIPTGPVSAGPSKLLIALIVIGGVLLLGIVAIVFLLIGQKSGSGTVNAGAPTAASASPTAPATQAATSGPDATSAPAPAPDNSVRFTSFDYTPTVACDTTGQEEKPSPSISWSSANAVSVYWTPNNQDADASNGYEVGASGNQDDMSASKGPGERYEFPCNHRGTFDTTITLVGADGQTVSKSVTFTDTNWNN